MLSKDDDKGFNELLERLSKKPAEPINVTSPKADKNVFGGRGNVNIVCHTLVINRISDLMERRDSVRDQ